MEWHLPDKRYDEVRSAAADVIEDWGISIYPFSIWELLRKIGIRVYRYSELQKESQETLKAYYPDGITMRFSDYDPRRIKIYLNDIEKSPERIRFTLAHELAHIVLEHPGTGEEIYEHEADLFANYLLAPEPLISKYSAELDPAIVRDDFAVSYSCAQVACDRAKNRHKFGPAKRTEYELRILNSCHMVKGGGRLALS
jgi:Zn-dependent peptidase ImmA (M78 family)